MKTQSRFVNTQITAAAEVRVAQASTPKAFWNDVKDTADQT
jgi:hypothetical protein